MSHHDNCTYWLASSSCISSMFSSSSCISSMLSSCVSYSCGILKPSSCSISKISWTFVGCKSSGRINVTRCLHNLSALLILRCDLVIRVLTGLPLAILMRNRDGPLVWASLAWSACLSFGYSSSYKNPASPFLALVSFSNPMYLSADRGRGIGSESKYCVPSSKRVGKEKKRIRFNIM